ncbi:MAG: hypothetical protein KatS3mg027_0826 [Bacteroidia bacterium]|nr:MAG: hypothetical protein KatS3mg027_0826 [Bacteroidia bacterium]
MHFIYPNVLWALSLLLIPVIIHFFNIRRYKKIYFSDIQRIKQIAQQTQIRNKLKERLILIVRILSFLFLILAFAQPVYKNKSSHFSNTINNEIVIYIDNSFSMDNVSDEGKLLDIAIHKAKEVIQSFPKSTKFYILTNHQETTPIKKLSQNEALEALSKISVQPTSISLSTLFNKIQTLHIENPMVFILSDAQKKFTDIPALHSYHFPIYYFLLEPTQKNNISIDSVWIENPIVLPNVPHQLHIKLTNHNSENVNDLPVKIALNDVQVALLNVSIPSHQSIETYASFLPKNQHIQFGKVFINDFPVTFDDEMFFTINTNFHLNALLINGKENPVSSRYFRTFFQNDSLFTFNEQTETQINFSELSKQDIIVLNEITEYSSALMEQLKLLSQKGKSILIIPFIENNNFILPPDISSIQWSIDTNRQNISSKILKHPLFASTFDNTDQSFKMPVVKKYLKPNSPINDEIIIQLNNDQPFLLQHQSNNGRYFIFTSSFNPDVNLFAQHSLFVPVLYQLSFLSIPKTPLYYYCSNSNVVKIPNLQLTSKQTPKLISATPQKSNFQIIPGFKTEQQTSFIYLNSYFNILPGYYYLQVNNTNILGLSFNYNRAESDMQFYSESELKDILQKLGLSNIQVNSILHIPPQKIIQSEINGTSYWKLCLILALLFFITESILTNLSFTSIKLNKKSN